MSEIVPFIDAQPGDHAYTYRPDPSGEFGWVTDAEWFDDIDGPVTVTRQCWLLERTETVVFHPRHELCPTCRGDEEVVLPPVRPTGEDFDGHPVQCPTCKSNPGLHPLAGEMEIVDE